MITIHYDFTNGTEVSYVEGKKLKNNFTTCCLDFFNMDEKVDDVVILRKDGSYISRKFIQRHTSKEVRNEHNIHKMLKAGCFEWLNDSKYLEGQIFTYKCSICKDTGVYSYGGSFGGTSMTAKCACGSVKN